MKITDPDVIKNGEKDLIEAIKDDLDLDAVKEILKDRIAQSILSAKGGRIIVHDNQVAFKLDFDLNVSGSLVFDRDGNYISQVDDPAAPDDNDPALSEPVDLDDVGIHDAFEETGPEDDDLTEDDSLEKGKEDLLPDGVEDSTEDTLEIEPDPDDPADSLEDLPDDGTEDLSVENEGIETFEAATEPDMPADQDIQPAESEGGIDDILQESREFWEQKNDS